MKQKYLDLEKILPKKLIVDMVDWSLDCAVNDEDAENIKMATNAEIIRWVDRQYYGGLKAFIETEEYPLTNEQKGKIEKCLEN